jgi:hypothetical protein
MEILKKQSSVKSCTKNVKLDNGDCYELKKIDNNHLSICDQNIELSDKVETITVDYKNHFMTGFQFRKKLKNIQYRWFNINTINKRLSNSDWGNI